MASSRFNITLQDDVVSRIDAYCKRTGTTRSAFIATACLDYIDAVEKKPIAIGAFSQLGQLFKLAFDGKTESAEYDDALNHLEAAFSTLKGGGPKAP